MTTNKQIKVTVIVLAFFFFCISTFSSFAQNIKAKRFTYGLHDYIFYSDGTYIEYIDEILLSNPNQYCSQCVIDSGRYSEKRGCYILNSSGKIDSMRMYDIISSYEMNDSLIIEFFSPYEKIIQQNINYAIYTYTIQILCDSSFSGKIFERDFNETHRFCMSGHIRVQKPKDVRIREVRMVIYPNDIFYQYFISFSSDPVIRIKYISENNDNLFLVNMPYFEYLSLTYRNRKACEIKKHKNWISSGTYYKRNRPRKF